MNKSEYELQRLCFSMLKENKTLRMLRLEGNRLGDSSAVALGQALLVNANLLDLRLCWNWIGDFGAKALAEAYASGMPGRFLVMQHNNVTSEGLRALHAAAEMNNATICVQCRGQECTFHSEEWTYAGTS